MLLAPIVDRLKSECPGLREVLLALGGGTPPGYPSAYVIPLAEAAQPNDLYGAHTQKVAVRFAVELMVKHAAQAATGGPAQEVLEALRSEILAALIGWSPATGFDAIDFAGGRLVDFAAGFATWRDEFTTVFYMEKP